MDEIKLVLRFRNFVKDADGVEEHQKIIHQTKGVYWGWWKRVDEPIRNELFSSLSVPFCAWLISPSEELQYIATISRLSTARPPKDLVPTYYQDQFDKIPAWFYMTEIRKVDFDEQLGSQIRNSQKTVFEIAELKQTFALKKSEIDKSKVPAYVVETESSVIVHISDIHLGDDHNFVPISDLRSAGSSTTGTSRRMTLANALKKDLKVQNIERIGAVVVSGDIVTRSNWKMDEVIPFFENLATTLGIDRQAILFVPGNHDFYRQGNGLTEVNIANYEHEASYRNFWASFHGLPPYLNDGVPRDINRCVRIKFSNLMYDLAIGLLNSARWCSLDKFTEYGFVGKEKYALVLDEIKEKFDRPSVRLLMLHHHLVPIQPMEKIGPGTLKPVSLTLDASELLVDAQEAGITMVLHGHQHRADLIKVARSRHDASIHGSIENEGIYVCAAGSAGSKQLPDKHYNTYSVLSFNDARVACAMRVLDPEGNVHREILKEELVLRILS